MSTLSANPEYPTVSVPIEVLYTIRDRAERIKAASSGIVVSANAKRIVEAVNNVVRGTPSKPSGEPVERGTL